MENTKILEPCLRKIEIKDSTIEAYMFVLNTWLDMEVIQALEPEIIEVDKEVSIAKVILETRELSLAMEILCNAMTSIQSTIKKEMIVRRQVEQMMNVSLDDDANITLDLKYVNNIKNLKIFPYMEKINEYELYNYLNVVTAAPLPVVNNQPYDQSEALKKYNEKPNPYGNDVVHPKVQINPQDGLTFTPMDDWDGDDKGYTFEDDYDPEKDALMMKDANALMQQYMNSQNRDE